VDEIAPLRRRAGGHRFHNRKIKRLCLFIARYTISKSKARQRQVKAAFRTLIERVQWIVAVAGHFCDAARSSSNLDLAGVALELQAFLPSMQTVAATAWRAQVKGETVPARDRVFSIFEPHTELLKRGKRQKPTEFGHKVLLCETPEKFITDYEVYERQQADVTVHTLGRSFR
jgi:IS5 family transposase